MKKVSEAERCEETFDGARCSKRTGHFGKHLSLDNGWFGWTDQGKARVLQERAELEKQE
jgi:hypothetical protein